MDIASRLKKIKQNLGFPKEKPYNLAGLCLSDWEGKKVQKIFFANQGVVMHTTENFKEELMFGENVTGFSKVKNGNLILIDYSDKVVIPYFQAVSYSSRKKPTYEYIAEDKQTLINGLKIHGWIKD